MNDSKKNSAEFSERCIKNISACVLLLIGECMKTESVEVGDKVHVTAKLDVHALSRLVSIAIAGAIHTLIASISKAESASFETQREGNEPKAGFDYAAIADLFGKEILRNFQSGHTKDCEGCHTDIAYLSQMIMTVAASRGFKSSAETTAASSAVH